MKVLVGIAAFNDEEGLSLILPQVPKEITGHNVDVLVVDDGSTDRTKEVARGFNCLLISHPKNMGHGMARKTALKYAQNEGYEWIITMDGDGQHLPSFLSKFLEALLKGYNIVRASRFHHQSPKEKLPPQWLELNQQVTTEVNRVTGWRLTDALCGMMGLPVPFVQDILPYLLRDDYGYAIEILLRLWQRFKDLRIFEIPHPPIYQGTTKLENTYGQDLTARIKRYNYHIQQIKEFEAELGLS
jgi:dolichol-phosphate mannosyltransferase